MAFIVEQFTGDRGVQVGVEDIVRKMPWGTNWTKIRVCCRVATNGYSTISVPAYPPRLGICVGAESLISNTALSAICWSTLNPQNATYLGSAPYNYYFGNNSSSNYFMGEKVGSSFNYLGNYSGFSWYWSANPTVVRSPYFVDFYKTGAVSTLLSTVYSPASVANVTTDCTRSNFLAMMENESSVINCGSTGNAGLTVSRTQMDWDSIFFNWNRAVPTTTIYDLSVVRFY